MNREELVAQAQRLSAAASKANDMLGLWAQACEFLRIYAGPDNSFLPLLKTYSPLNYNAQAVGERTAEILNSFADYVGAGLHGGISPERQAQLDVVSDFLEMSDSLLHKSEVHPASAAMLIGATLEEFLRTWVEADGLVLGARKPSLDAYSQVLREANLITKQDAKDITSWAGVRNHAAHGEWDEVSDRNRIRLMLEGVNLFMRRYSP